MPAIAAATLKWLALALCLCLAVESGIEAAVFSGSARLASKIHCDVHCASALAGPAPEQNAPPATQVRLALARLREDPLDAAALRVLARHEMLADPVAGDRLLRLAERVTRRDAPVQVALVDAAIRARDPESVLVHADRLLSTAPRFTGPVATVLAGGLADAGLRERLARQAARPWFGAVLASVADPGRDPQAIVMLATSAARRLPPADGQALLARILQPLLAHQQYPAARALLASLPAGRVRALAQAGFSGAAVDPAWAPLAWTLHNDEQVATEVDGGALLVRVAPLHRVLAAERMTLLVPGIYRFHRRTGAVAGSPVAATNWQVACSGGAMLWQDRPVADGMVAGGEFVVPAGCEAQTWKLWSEASESQYESLVRIDRLAIDPSGGKVRQ